MAQSVGSGQREQRRLQRQDLSRNQLLDAAEEVFGRKGFHEATLKEVAEIAEFAVGSVYSFFDSKDDLYRQIFVRRSAQFDPALRAALDPRHGTSLDQLHRLVDVQVRPFDGIVASYQASDPAVLSTDPDPGEAFPLADLHDLIEMAFRA